MSQPSHTIATKDALPLIRSLLEKLSIETDLPDNEASKASQLSILERLLTAETEEEVYERQEAGTTSTKDFVNIPFRVLNKDITWKKSARQYQDTGAFPFFVQMRVTVIESGEQELISGGGYSFVGAMFRLQELGAFDKYERAHPNDAGKPLQIISKAMMSGFSVLLVKPVFLDKKAPKKSSEHESAAV